MQPMGCQGLRGLTQPMAGESPQREKGAPMKMWACPTWPRALVGCTEKRSQCRRGNAPHVCGQTIQEVRQPCPLGAEGHGEEG